MPPRVSPWFLIALAGCSSKPAKAPPEPDRAIPLPAPRAPIVVACPTTVPNDARCFLPDDERLALRNKVGIELQRIETDFVNAWNALPPSPDRTRWFTLRTRLDLEARGIPAPPGTTVPQAYQAITEDVYRRLPALDDGALQMMHATAKATTREQMERSIIDYRQYEQGNARPPTP